MTHDTTKTWQRLWSRVKEPKVISFLVWTGYLALAAVWIYALLDPPTTIVGGMGPLAMSITSGLIAVGGILGAIGSLPGWQLTERLGIAAALGGIVIYMSLLSYLQVTGEGNRLPQLGVIYFAFVSLIGRWIRIKDHVFELGSKASERAKRKHPSIHVRTGSLSVVREDEEY